MNHYWSSILLPPSSTPHSKTTSCTIGLENARGILPLCRTVFGFSSYSIFSKFSERSPRSLNPTFSAVSQGQKDYIQQRNKEEMNANNVSNNKGTLNTKASD